MRRFRDHLNESLEDPEFESAWNELEPEYAMIQAIINARKNSNMTQKELSKKTGITQADISRIENGNANPALSTLKRLADGMGMVLKLEFIPKQAR